MPALALDRDDSSLLRWQCLLPYAVALAIRLLMLFTWDRVLFFDGADFYSLGTQIGLGLGFTHPDGSIAAFRGPALPYLLGGWYALFGNGLLLSGAFLLTIEFLTLPLFSLWVKRIGGERAANIAVWIWGIQPFTAVLALAHHADFLAVTISLLMFLLERDDQPTRVRSFGSGFLIGILALSRPLFQLMVPVIMVIRFRQWRKLGRPLGWRYLTTHFVILLAGYSLLVLPWMFRNQVKAGSFTIAIQYGINLYVGFHDGANGGYKFTEEDARHGPKDGLGLQSDRYYGKLAREYIVSHPLQVAKLTIMKVIHSLAPHTRDWVLYETKVHRSEDTWAMSYLPWWQFLVLTLVSALMLLPGWWALWVDGAPFERLLVPIGFAFVSVVTMWVFFADPRYRIVAETLTVGCAAIALHNGNWKITNRWRKTIAVAGSVGILLVTVAFIIKRVVLSS